MKIQAKNVSKSYEGKVILQDFSFSVSSGEIKCIMANSGGGKTTFLRLLLGLEKPDSGEILLPSPCRFGAVFQENRLLEHLDAFANLRFALGQDFDRSLSSALLAELGLDDASGKPVKEYSGGMKRRLSLARALLASSDALILDEPFTGLDEENKAKCIQLILRYSSGKPVIIVTHDADDAASLHAEIVKLPVT